MGTADRRDRDFQQREAALLAAAAALSEDGDWQAVTVDQIAARAEYAKGTVYKHFASKDEICARLAVRQAADLIDALGRIDASRPFEPVLRDVLAVWWRHLRARRARLAELARDGEVLAGLRPEARAALAEADARHAALLEDLVAIGIDEGALPLGPAAPRLLAVRALMHGAARLRDWPGAGAIPEAALADAVLALLRAAPASPGR